MLVGYLPHVGVSTLFDLLSSLSLFVCHVHTNTARYDGLCELR